MNVLGFQRTWIDASQQKERSAHVTHFNDLCEVLGVRKPLDADPTGDAYGWPEDDVPGEVEEDMILSRLLALNGEPAGTA